MCFGVNPLGGHGSQKKPEKRRRGNQKLTAKKRGTKGSMKRGEKKGKLG